MEESPIAPEVQEQTNSNFFKIARAVDGDSLFKIRVEMALEISGKPSNRTSLVHIASAVVDDIYCTVEGTVNSEQVTDAQISDAIESIPVSTTE